MERLGPNVKRELDRFGPQGSIGRLVDVWPEAVGEAIARNAWPARVARDGTLHVSASSSAWAFELAQLAPTILEHLRELAGPDAPAKLRFAPGRVPEPRQEGSGEHSARAVEVAPGARVEAERIAAAIDDEELRELVARAAAASLSRRLRDRPI